ncbi:MAG TPA: hypothetical protein VFL77_09270 [Solirubrobacterales bacterium]|nr:hypothetical protein [Solirubrobacterales bacterium]
MGSRRPPPTRTTATRRASCERSCSSTLIREKTVGFPEFAERDRMERAIRDLTAIGLLHRRDDDLLIPTRVAVRAYLLFDA